MSEKITVFPVDNPCNRLPDNNTASSNLVVSLEVLNIEAVLTTTGLFLISREWKNRRSGTGEYQHEL